MLASARDESDLQRRRKLARSAVADRLSQRAKRLDERADTHDHSRDGPTSRLRAESCPARARVASLCATGHSRC